MQETTTATNEPKRGIMCVFCILNEVEVIKFSASSSTGFPSYLSSIIYILHTLPIPPSPHLHAYYFHHFDFYFCQLFTYLWLFHQVFLSVCSDFIVIFTYVRLYEMDSNKSINWNYFYSFFFKLFVQFRQ